jgi:hypothetical protein
VVGVLAGPAVADMLKTRPPSEVAELRAELALVGIDRDR